MTTGVDAPHSSLPIVPRLIAEFAGTFVMVFAAAGSVMADELSGGSVTLLGMGLISGLVIAVVVHSIGHLSGAHINPAVTLGLVVGRYLRVRDALPYIGAQLAGAALAGGCLRAMLGPIANVGGHLPAGGTPQAFGMEIVITFMLMFVVMAVVTDRRAPTATAALAIGAAIAVGIVVGGPVSGGSMNPARTFGPALAAGNWAGHWIYWAGPAIGALLAALTYGQLAALTRLGKSKRNGRPDDDQSAAD